MSNSEIAGARKTHSSTMPPMVVGTWGTTQANHCYAERISKEEERMKQRPVRPDPT